MAQRNSQSETQSPSSKPGMAAVGEQAERVSQFQSELFTKIQEINQHWLERAQSEVALATEFASKMTSARSLPDATTVCQEWAGQRMKLAAEDANYALTAGRTLIETGTRLLQSNGKGSLAST